MKGNEVYNVLQEKNIPYLYHANSVTTSCTFLTKGGLLSRGYVESRKLQQTPQASDEKDKQVGVWDDTFMDTVDIHARAKQYNEYGPVLFVMQADILASLPAGTEVLVTKDNPIYWTDRQPEDEKYFVTADKLRDGLVKGTFKQMIIVRTPAGLLSFGGFLTKIVFDDPVQKRGGSDVFQLSERKLQAAAGQGRVRVTIEKRQCVSGCRCLTYYQGGSAREDFF